MARLPFVRRVVIVYVLASLRQQARIVFSVAVQCRTNSNRSQYVACNSAGDLENGIDIVITQQREREYWIWCLVGTKVAPQNNAERLPNSRQQPYAKMSTTRGSKNIGTLPLRHTIPLV